MDYGNVLKAFHFGGGTRVAGNTVWSHTYALARRPAVCSSHPAITAIVLLILLHTHWTASIRVKTETVHDQNSHGKIMKLYDDGVQIY